MFGDYPPEMKHYHGSELPTFSPEERLLLKDSIDFIGINHYGTLYAKDCIHSNSHCNDSGCMPGCDHSIRGFICTTGEHDGVFIGDRVLYHDTPCSSTAVSVLIILSEITDMHLCLYLFQTGMSRFFVVPRGMEDIVQYVKKRYSNKPMYITENGKLVHSFVIIISDVKLHLGFLENLSCEIVHFRSNLHDTFSINFSVL